MNRHLKEAREKPCRHLEAHDPDTGHSKDILQVGMYLLCLKNEEASVAEAVSTKENGRS